MCSVTDISATVTPMGVKVCMMVDLGPGYKVPFGGDIFRGQSINKSIIVYYKCKKTAVYTQVNGE